MPIAANRSRKAHAFRYDLRLDLPPWSAVVSTPLWTARPDAALALACHCEEHRDTRHPTRYGKLTLSRTC